MKRDLNLIRSILLDIESVPSNKLSVYDVAEKHQVPADLVMYQLIILSEAGFIKLRGLTIAFTPNTRKYDDIKIERLTLHGHDYLDTIRNDTVWKKTLQKIEAVGPSVAFELVSKIASHFIDELF